MKKIKALVVFNGRRIVAVHTKPPVGFEEELRKQNIEFDYIEHEDPHSFHSRFAQRNMMLGGARDYFARAQSTVKMLNEPRIRIGSDIQLIGIPPDSTVYFSYVDAHHHIIKRNDEPVEFVSFKGVSGRLNYTPNNPGFYTVFVDCETHEDITFTVFVEGQLPRGTTDVLEI